MRIKLCLFAMLSLSQVALAVEPRVSIHRDGMAATQCLPEEEQQTLGDRQICVDSSGQYYFLVEEVKPKNFKPLKLIHTSGKAITRCSEGEEEQNLDLRKICVDNEGNFYFIAW